MRKRRYRKLINVLLYIPLLLLVYILQAMVFSRLPIQGTKPLIIPLAVVGISLFGGGIRGGIFGLFAGILCDISLNQPTIQFTLILTAFGMLVGFAADTFLVRGFPTFVLCSIIVLFVSAFAQSFTLIFYYGCEVSACIQTGIIQTVYSLLFAVPIYYYSRNTSRLHRL